MVAVVNSWSSTFSRPTGFVIPAPVNSQLPFTLTGGSSGTPGNWLIAIVGWQQPQDHPDTPTTFAVGDNLGNLWEPIGQPAGTSPAAGQTRVSAWACPNPGVVATVYATPNGPFVSAGVLAFEVSGLSSWITGGTGITAFALNATSLAALNGPPLAGAPLNVNSMFAAGTAPWTAGAGASIAQSLAWGYQAPFAMAVTANGSAGVSASSEMAPVTAAQTYSASFWALCPEGSPSNAQAVTNWYNSSGTFLSSSSGASVALAAGQFAYVQVSAAAPAGAAFARIITQLQGTPPAGTQMFVSRAIIGLASPALWITAACGDLSTVTVTGPGAGWTALPAVSTTNGTDHTADILLDSAWQVSSAAVSAAWSGSAATDWAGIAVGILVQGIVPVPPQQNWPYLRVQLGLGSGAQTPWDQIGWTEITPRYRGSSGSRGKQYELDQIQSATSNWTLGNNDGFITPGNPLSPYAPYVEDYTPVRLLASWPPPPAQVSKTYSVVRHFMERWPQARTSTRYQNTGAISVDMWTLLTPEQVTVARGDMVLDDAVGLWPLDDPAGSTVGRNLAPSGGVGSLQVVQSKYGTGGSIRAFQSVTDPLVGDSGGSAWTLSSVPAADNQGLTLYCADPNLPPISAGLTLDGWFQMVGTQPTGANLALLTVRNAKGTIWQLYIPQSSGHLMLDVFDKTTGAKTTTTINGSQNWITAASLFHVMISFNATSWQVWVNGGSFGAVSGSANFATSPWWFSANGTADRISTGQFFNGNVTLVGCYPLMLIQTRAVSHFWAALTGIQGEDGPAARMDRLLGMAQCSFPRLLAPAGDQMQGALDIAQQAVAQNVQNIATSDNGLLLVNGAGYLRYIPRAGQWNLPITWTFGEEPGRPLNANTDFETGTAPWAPQNAATLTQSSGWSKTGRFSALFTGNGSTASPQIASENVAVTPGVSYTASTWLFCPQGWATGCRINMVWKNGSGTTLSTTTGTLTPVTAGAPVFLATTGQAPAGAATATMIILASGTPATSVMFFVDVAQLATTATEYPYLEDFASDHDPTQVFNDVELDQEQAPASIGLEASGVTILLTNAASILQFGDRTVQETIYTAAVQPITDLANWIVNTMRAPQTRIANMTLDPAANPALWPVVLSLETGQVVWVNSRLIDQTQISGPFQVMTVAYSNEPGSWKTTVTAIPYTGYALACDDPAHGVLDGINRLGW